MRITLITKYEIRTSTQICEDESQSNAQTLIDTSPCYLIRHPHPSASFPNDVSRVTDCVFPLARVEWPLRISCDGRYVDLASNICVTVNLIKIRDASFRFCQSRMLRHVRYFQARYVVFSEVALLLSLIVSLHVVFESVIVKSREPKANRGTRELGTKRSEQLARISEKFVIRRTGDVIAQFLPPKSASRSFQCGIKHDSSTYWYGWLCSAEYVVFVIPTKLQIEIYEEILRGHAVSDVLNGQGGGQLVLMSVLQKLCNSPGLLAKSAKAVSPTFKRLRDR